jgi:hypothetical protein
MQSNTMKVHPIYTQPHRLLAKGIRIPLRFGVRRVQAVARLAFEALATELRFASFNLFFCLMTVWTFPQFTPHASFSPLLL